MTSISQYLQAESIDTSDEVTFYVPGGESWGKREVNGIRLARRSRAEIELVYLESDEDDNPDY